MLVEYNGVVLTMVKTKQYRREVVYDDAKNYLYTRHTIVFDAVFNPANQSDNYPNDGHPLITSAQTSTQPYDPTQGIGPLRGSLGVSYFGPGFPILPRPPALAPLVPSTSLASRRVNGTPVFFGGGTGPFTTQQVSPPDLGVIPGCYSAEAIKHRLLQPRGYFRWSEGGVVLIVSPLPGFTVDASYGPQPLWAHVTQATMKTAHVEFAIQTDINECSRFKDSPSQDFLILSHNFQIEHRLDEHYFTERITTGRVKFRSDTLAMQPRTIELDLFRSFLFLIIPANFKRISVEIKPEPNLLDYSYRIVDREMPLNWHKANITKLEAIHEITTRRAPPDEALIDLADQVISTFSLGSNTASIATTGQRPPTPQAPQQPKLNTGSTNIHPVATLASNFPVSYHRVQVNVWGNRLSNRQYLEQFALQIIYQRLSAFYQLAILFGEEQSIKHDIAGKFVSVNRVFISGPAVGAIIGQGVDGSTIPAIDKLLKQALMPDDDDTGTFIHDANLHNTPESAVSLPGPLGSGDIPGPPSSNMPHEFDPGYMIPGGPVGYGTRGTYLEMAIARTLLNPCQGIVQPGRPPTFYDPNQVIPGLGGRGGI
jgi:hypothetical protein